VGRSGDASASCARIRGTRRGALGTAAAIEWCALQGNDAHSRGDERGYVMGWIAVVQSSYGALASIASRKAQCRNQNSWQLAIVVKHELDL